MVPVLAKGKKQPVSHRIPEHIEKMECHSCHAAWTAQDYGLHLVLQESRGYAQWAHSRRPLATPNARLAYRPAVPRSRVCRTHLSRVGGLQKP
ncbi:MAG: hypothetical protein JRI79_15150 [Deltaproteobacteria bacterium]|nr:hypothetical protein [Deltaproteobacteria bacterium]